MMPPGAPQGYPSAAPPQQQFTPPAQQYQAPQQPAQVPQTQPQAAAVDAALHQKLDQVLANQQKILESGARLAQEWSVLQAGLSTWIRVTYQMKPGSPDLKATLTELGIQFPQ